MSKRIDLTGQTIGGCQCMSATDTWGMWVWSCHCSNTFEHTGHAIKTAMARLGIASCGCLATAAKSLTGRNNRTHGRASGPDRRLYDVWRQMHRRCENVTSKDYHAYGARGISVCSEWGDVNAFCEWARASGYRRGLTIERRLVDGNYGPDNCTWVPMHWQALNTRKNVRLKFDGKDLPASEWSRITGIHVQTILQRVRNGWSDHDTLTITPVHGRNQAWAV